MSHFHDIYQSEADRYDVLVSAADPEGNLPKAINRICPLDGIDILESGAGTGRVTRLMAGQARFIAAFEHSPAMIHVATQRLRGDGHHNWSMSIADHRDLPARSNSFDMAIEGWSFSMLFFHGGDSWRDAIRRGIDEFRRVVRPGGFIMLIETLGTGTETPTIVHERFEGFYLDIMEGEYGMTREVVRTDGHFESAEQAMEISKWFYGEGWVPDVLLGDGRIVPECTGLWWKQID